MEDDTSTILYFETAHFFPSKLTIILISVLRTAVVRSMSSTIVVVVVVVVVVVAVIVAGHQDSDRACISWRREIASEHLSSCVRPFGQGMGQSLFIRKVGASKPVRSSFAYVGRHDEYYVGYESERQDKTRRKLVVAKQYIFEISLKRSWSGLL